MLWGGKKKYEPRRRQPRLEAPSTTFVRSRTLVGSASSRVRATSEDRGDVVSDRVRVHRLHRVRRRVQFFLGVFGAVGLIVALLIQGTMSSIRFASADQLIKPIDQAAYMKAWQEYTTKRPIESIRYFLKGDQWLAFLAQKYPEVKAVTVEAPTFFGEHVMILTLRQPIAVWRVDSEALYVDAKGVAYARNYYAEPTVAVIDESGISGIATEQSVASAQTMAFIGQVVAGVSGSGIGTVEKVVLPPGLLREIDIYLAGRGYRLKVNMTRDPGYQAADIAAALAYIDRKQLKPEYVDVRVAGKMYYR